MQIEQINRELNEYRSKLICCPVRLNPNRRVNAATRKIWKTQSEQDPAKAKELSVRKFSQCFCTHNLHNFAWPNNKEIDCRHSQSCFYFYFYFQFLYDVMQISAVVVPVQPPARSWVCERAGML